MEDGMAVVEMYFLTTDKVQERSVDTTATSSDHRNRWSSANSEVYNSKIFTSYKTPAEWS